MTTVQPDIAKATIARSIKQRPFFAAIGRGDGAWLDEGPPIESTATGLIDPYALLRPQAVQFVSPDDAGPIEAPDGSRWTVSERPTRHLHFEFVLGFQDMRDITLREYAIYLDSQLAADVLPGQTVIPWSSVTDPGDLLLITRTPPIERNGVRLTFGDIIDF